MTAVVSAAVAVVAAAAVEHLLHLSRKIRNAKDPLSKRYFGHIMFVSQLKPSSAPK